jgi:hypothetical protein
MRRSPPFPPARPLRRAFAAVLGITLAAALAACGQTQALEPPPGETLPPPPYGRADPPSAEELLQLDPQAAPERSVELRRRSEEREDDPFDLPPQG